MASRIKKLVPQSESSQRQYHRWKDGLLPISDSLRQEHIDLLIAGHDRWFLNSLSQLAPQYIGYRHLSHNKDSNNCHGSIDRNTGKPKSRSPEVSTTRTTA